MLKTLFTVAALARVLRRFANRLENWAEWQQERVLLGQLRQDLMSYHQST